MHRQALAKTYTLGVASDTDFPESIKTEKNKRKHENKKMESFKHRKRLRSKEEKKP